MIVAVSEHEQIASTAIATRPTMTQPTPAESPDRRRSLRSSGRNGELVVSREEMLPAHHTVSSRRVSRRTERGTSRQVVRDAENASPADLYAAAAIAITSSASVFADDSALMSRRATYARGAALTTDEVVALCADDPLRVSRGSGVAGIGALLHRERRPLPGPSRSRLSEEYAARSPHPAWASQLCRPPRRD